MSHFEIIIKLYHSSHTDNSLVTSNDEIHAVKLIYKSHNYTVVH